jgi:hypothetical protein
MRSAVLAVLLLTSLVGRALAAGYDGYDPADEEWYGLSAFAELAAAQGATLEVGGTLSSSLGSDVPAVLLLYPKGVIDPAGLRAFLERGGRALLADDFGRADALLPAFSLRRRDLPARPGASFGRNPDLPIATALGGHPVLEGVDRIVGNHATGLAGEGRPLATFGGTGSHLLMEVLVGRGRLLVLSDPSVLINTMLEQEGNRRFASNLARWLCAGRSGCRLPVHARVLAEGGGAGDGADGGEGALERLLSGLAWDRLNRQVLWMVSVVALGLVLLLLMALVPGGTETAWHRPPARDAPRPDPIGLRLAALLSVGPEGDGRVLASIVGARARELLAKALGQRGDRALFEALVERDRSAPGGISGMAGLIQDLEGTPPRADPYEPGHRPWTLGEVLDLQRRVDTLERRLTSGEGGELGG